MLEVKGLTRPGEFEDVSFTVRRGETLGITGLLGAGRTELAQTLFGMRKPKSGSIVLDGKPVRFGSNRDAIKAGVAYLSEDRLSLGLIQPQSIGDNHGHRLAEQDPVRRADLVTTAAQRSLAAGSRISASRSASRTTRSRRCPAATSSASPSPNGWPPTRSC